MKTVCFWVCRVVIWANLAVGSVVYAADQLPVLTVYASDSFTSDWGPGPELEKAFEARCRCDLHWVGLSGGASILQRLRLEGEASPADVVLSLDMNLMQAAQQTGLLAPYEFDLPELDLPVEWTSHFFVPYDWSHFAFVYDTQQLSTPPTSLKALVNAPDDLSIIIEDPRTSTPGFGLLLWVKAVYGDQAPEAWARLSRKILTVTPGWSEAYQSLFLKGEAPLVMSYSTSPAYHLTVEHSDRYRAAPFDEGHYLQVEVAAVTQHSAHPQLAQAFLQFLISEQAQKVLPLTNYMYPVIDIGSALPPAFNALIQPQSLLISPDRVADHRRDWIHEWLEAYTR